MAIAEVKDMAAEDVSVTEKGDRDLIDIVNELQNKLAASGHSLDVSLPQIVVVGCQSAGKSSVLENFVKRDFLPRGSGVVTRRPTVVQLQPTSGEVLKLTLVDLPGMIRIAVSGQSEDSINQIQEMVLNYISQPNCLILAVTPANQDIANSDALNIAKVADPERERTIGVLTKLDLMDEGTDARDILENKIIPLKRGYVGVLNRSQKDIDEGKDVKYILDKERKFFESKEYYKHIAHRMGTPYLQQLLQKTLRAHIKAYLPTVRNELAKKLIHYTKELEDFKNSTEGGVNGKQFYVIKLIQEFIDDVTIKLMGYSELVSVEKVSAGALIQFKLYTEIQKNLKLNLEARKEQLVMLTVNMLALRAEIVAPTAGTTKFWDCNDAEEDIATADAGAVAAKLFRNERMEKSVSYMTDIIKRYLEIVQKAMGDVAIKYTVYFLVKKVHVSSLTSYQLLSIRQTLTL
ncbi:dynamin-1-like isoform X1 [Stegodyphus dumicola]|uniref:dynamin-1-like isoform X1 n=1 Tax=Stegodyphus dumicola TaxID=202533 RepID=UPI0015AEEC26|nr:dynamin-1-like isoform X1 [Stegodyphus dumicola]